MMTKYQLGNPDTNIDINIYLYIKRHTLTNADTYTLTLTHILTKNSKTPFYGYVSTKSRLKSHCDDEFAFKYIYTYIYTYI